MSRRRIGGVHGRLEIESEPGRGTAISASVPLAAGDAASTAGGPIRLVIVNDHPVVRDGLRGMFTGDPEFEVVGEAPGGAEALTVVAPDTRTWC